MTKRIQIEERLKRIYDLFDNLSDMIDDLDIDLPSPVKQTVLKVLQSEDMIQMLDGIKRRRPPRVIIMGRSGVGKSSLINAMFRTYLAETSPINVGTKEHSHFKYEKDGKTIFEIIDTRGISENINELETSAEEDLYRLIEDFNPDAFLFLTSGSDRSTLKDDTAQLKRIFTQMDLKTPLITVITRVDEIDPARIKRANDYTERKLANIAEKKLQVKQMLKKAHLPHQFIVPVSAYIEWNDDAPELLPDEEKEELTIEYDGTYNIDELIDILEDNIDFNAALELMLSHEFEKSIEKIANQFVKRFSNTSFIVGASPMPVMDVMVLLPIQIIEVLVIAYLSGKEINAKAAREFIMSLGAVFLFGFGLRFVAQQGTKLLNVVPGAGSAISGTIAYSGTYSVGKAAIAYYVRGLSLKESKKVAEKAKKEAKDVDETRNGENKEIDIAEKEQNSKVNKEEKTLFKKFKKIFKK